MGGASIGDGIIAFLFHRHEECELLPIVVPVERREAWDYILRNLLAVGALIVHGVKRGDGEEEVPRRVVLAPQQGPHATKRERARYLDPRLSSGRVEVGSETVHVA